MVAVGDPPYIHEDGFVGELTVEQRRTGHPARAPGFYSLLNAQRGGAGGLAPHGNTGGRRFRKPAAGSAADRLTTLAWFFYFRCKLLQDGIRQAGPR